MKLRKLLFVLPNLFTVSSIFCGFYALTLCTGDASPAQLYQAALAIFFGIFFDGFDGRVARLTKTQSMFGQELDSLADVVTFGAARALQRAGDSGRRGEEGGRGGGAAGVASAEDARGGAVLRGPADSAGRRR